MATISLMAPALWRNLARLLGREEMVMKLDWESWTIAASHVTRFINLNARLENTSFIVGSFFHKSKRIVCKYTPYHVSPPRSLFGIGRSWRILNTECSVSFGGTVSPTADGFQLAALLAQEAVLKHKAIVIGGGVIGIDMAAHLGALDVNGRTVAVLANPVTCGLHPYNPRRAFMENGILEQGGALVSEYDEPSKDLKERLLQRDRIITALSDFFFAVECSRDSATVDAAKRAKIQGKKVLAVDWSKVENTWHKPKNSGAQQLFDEGIAAQFPEQKVSSIRDLKLLEEFHKVL